MEYILFSSKNAHQDKLMIQLNFGNLETEIPSLFVLNFSNGIGTCKCDLYIEEMELFFEDATPFDENRSYINNKLKLLEVFI